MSFARLVAALALLLAAFAPDGLAQRAPREAVGEIHVSQLPPEARQTLALIRTEGPYPYAKDGAIFGNREGLLPRQKRGYYREYTVKTPGNRTRGARRIVAGQAGERYYTEDHYKSFRRIRE
jgi:ribonuclease T1